MELNIKWLLAMLTAKTDAVRNKPFSGVIWFLKNQLVPPRTIKTRELDPRVFRPTKSNNIPAKNINGKDRFSPLEKIKSTINNPSMKTLGNKGPCKNADTKVKNRNRRVLIFNV